MDNMDMAMGAFALFSFFADQKKKNERKKRKSLEREITQPTGRSPGIRPAALPQTKQDVATQNEAMRIATETFRAARAQGGSPQMSASIALLDYKEAGGNQAAVIEIYQKAIDPERRGIRPTGVYDTPTVSYLEMVKRWTAEGNQGAISAQESTSLPSEEEPPRDEGDPSEGPEEDDAADDALELEAMAQDEGWSPKHSAAAGLEEYLSHNGQDLAFIARQQQKMGLPPTGAVDEPTRKAIDRLLREQTDSINEVATPSESNAVDDPSIQQDKAASEETIAPVISIEPTVVEVMDIPGSISAAAQIEAQREEYASLSKPQKAAHKKAHAAAHASYMQATRNGQDPEGAANAYLDAYMANGGPMVTFMEAAQQAINTEHRIKKAGK